MYLVEEMISGHLHGVFTVIVYKSMNIYYVEIKLISFMLSAVINIIYAESVCSN